jgi:hypothetical protein
VDVMLAKYAITQNPIFLWEALEALTAPVMAGVAVEMPTVLREYMQQASLRIVRAAHEPPREFPFAAARALGFSWGKSGDSVPKEYARDSSNGILLMVYEEAKHRHGAKGATEFMASALSIEPGTMNTRLTAARKFDDALRDKLGLPSREDAPPQREWQELPDVVLVQVLRGMPDRFWRGIKAMPTE